MPVPSGVTRCLRCGTTEPAQGVRRSKNGASRLELCERRVAAATTKAMVMHALP